MVAAAYKVSMTVRNAKGQVKPYFLTASDVNAEFWLHPSGGSELPLSALDCVIEDVILSAAGTDTSQVGIFINGFDTGTRIINAANLGTVIQRQMASTRLRIPANAQVKFKQIT
jgi:hypothetical protein